MPKETSEGEGGGQQPVAAVPADFDWKMTRDVSAAVGMPSVSGLAPRLCRRTHLFVARAGRRKYRCDGCRKGFAACFLDGHDAARRGQEPLCADYPARRYRVGQHAAGFRGTQRCGRRNEKRRSAENPHFRGYTQRKLVDARLSDAVGQGGKRLRRGCRYPPDAGGQYRPRSQLDRQTLCRGGGILHSRGRRDYGQYRI